MTRNNKLALAALAVLTAAAPMSAFAAPPKPNTHAQKTHEEFVTGAIASVSASDLKLVSGESFKVKAGVTTSSFKAGDKVSVRYTEMGGAKTADQIKAANK
ncbi:MAG: hypothetical protein QM773_03605 [Hyphomonadaceae bacterium]